jgi:hypothetical protein
MSQRRPIAGSGLSAGWRWLCRAPFLLAVLGLLVIGAEHAVAVTPSTETTISIIGAPTETIIGQEIAFSARITAAGKPVTSRLLVLVLDGRTLRTASVDANGVAHLAIRGSEIPSAHTAAVLVRFPGAPTLAASQASFTLVVKPAEVMIETVPTTDGISVSLGAMTAVTKGGVAVFEVLAVGRYTLTPNVSASANDSVRADFVRWSDDVFTAARDIEVTGDLALQLGLRVAYRGSIEFRDAAGALLDPSEVESVTLTSTSGSGETLSGNYQSIWLEGGTAVKRGTGAEGGTPLPRAASLVVSPRSWRVVEVRIHGTNVVNRGQQSTQPTAGAVWQVTVLLFDLTVEAHDAILGSSLSGIVDLEYPDGTIVTVRLGSSSALVFRGLPRGSYTLRLHAGGLAASTPVALSRSQASVIRVITIVDQALVGGLALIAVGALLWFGRRRQMLRMLMGVQQRLAVGRQAASGAVTRLGRTTRSRYSESYRRLLSRRRSSGDAARSELSIGEVLRRIHAPTQPEEAVTGDPLRSGVSGRRPGAATCPRCGRFVSAQARVCRSCGFTIPGSTR